MVPGKIITYIFSFIVLTSETPINSRFNTSTIIKHYGYPVEEHHDITTEDGYILTMHRVPCGRRSPCSREKSKPAILLGHGMGVSSWEFVFLNPNISLAYLLADEGYDVWMANFRGTKYSTKHVRLSNKNLEYWNYSFHELGFFDLPACIDYVINYTNQSNIYYVGHSQGSTVLFVLATLRPEYNKKIRLSHHLGTPVYLEFKDKPIPKRRKQLLKDFEIYNNIRYDYLNDVIVLIKKIFPISTTNSIYKALYSFIIRTVGGTSDPSTVDDSIMPLLLIDVPSNVTTKQVLHFLQNLLAGRFSYYNYGSKINLRAYGREFPPEYDLSKVTSAVAIYLGLSESTIRQSDVNNIVKACPNVVSTYVIPRESFDHVQYIYASDFKELILKEMLRLMKIY